MRFKTVLLLCILLAGKVAFTQNYHHNVFWLRVALADTINKNTKLELFLQKRTQSTVLERANPFKSDQFSSIWFWVNFTLSKTSKFSVSPIGYFESHVLNTKISDENIPPVKEYRFSVRYTNDQKGKIVNFSNRYSLEYRLRDLQYNGVYQPNFRFRYMAKLEKPVYGIFSKDRPVTFELNDEVFLQFGKAVHNNANVFDQNRLYAGFSYEVVKNFKTSLGYIYNFQERKSGDEFDNSNIFWVVLTFDNLISQFLHKKH
ncbi:MAG: DUF2490 domain-containing protein [Chitinophagaceae bacterium]|nr:MAG: DUF2490 domain-containing protein [Chitinophagaceae bacterium]